jgi:hypothetical protein
MRIKKNSKNHVFLNWNGEHIAGCLIHLNVLQFVKSFTNYYIKYVYPRIWVNKVYAQELRLEKSFTYKNLKIKSFLAV